MTERFGISGTTTAICDDDIEWGGTVTIRLLDLCGSCGSCSDTIAETQICVEQVCGDCGFTSEAESFGGDDDLPISITSNATTGLHAIVFDPTTVTGQVLDNYLAQFVGGTARDQRRVDFATGESFVFSSLTLAGGNGRYASARPQVTSNCDEQFYGPNWDALHTDGMPVASAFTEIRQTQAPSGCTPDQPDNPTGPVITYRGWSHSIEIQADGSWEFPVDCVPCLDCWCGVDGAVASDRFGYQLEIRPLRNGMAQCVETWAVHGDCSDCGIAGIVKPLIEIGFPS